MRAWRVKRWTGAWTSLRARIAFVAFAAGVCLRPWAAEAQPAGRGAPDPDDPALAALALALAATPVPQPPDGTAVKEPRVELVVTFTARAVVFDELPRIRVAFGGPGPRRAAWKVERTNLPERVERGVEYRDVKVRLTLWSAPDEFEALLEDARRVAGGIRAEGTVPQEHG